MTAEAKSSLTVLAEYPPHRDGIMMPFLTHCQQTAVELAIGRGYQLIPYHVDGRAGWLDTNTKRFYLCVGVEEAIELLACAMSGEDEENVVDRNTLH